MVPDSDHGHQIVVILDAGCADALEHLRNISKVECVMRLLWSRQQLFLNLTIELQD